MSTKKAKSSIVNGVTISTDKCLKCEFGSLTKTKKFCVRNRAKSLFMVRG